MSTTDFTQLSLVVIEATTTTDQFRQWLNSQLPDSIVGVRRCARQCPIAQFLVSLHICDDTENPIRVADNSVSVRKSRYGYAIIVAELPQWAKLFIRHVDVFETYVNQQRALYFLDSVEEMMSHDK